MELFGWMMFAEWLRNGVGVGVEVGKYWTVWLRRVQQGSRGPGGDDHCFSDQGSHGCIGRLYVRLFSYHMLCNDHDAQHKLKYLQNMISAGTPVRRTANREPRTANLWLMVAEANAGHRCCNITDRGPQKRLNYNDKGLKLRANETVFAAICIALPQ
jgi:hypothetical protein